jgi:hypothetical protein
MKFVTDKTRGILGTPDSEELWSEIIAQIPDEVLLKPGLRILNLACGHCTEAVLLVKRMIALGIPKDQVQESFWLLDKYQVFTNTARSRFGFKNVITADALEWFKENKMKFDLVLGNPPYQDPSKPDSYQLWSRFFLAGFDLLREGSSLLFVTPPIKRNKNVVDVFNSNYVSVYKGNDIGKYFPDIGTEFCYYRVIKTFTKGLTKIDDGQIQLPVLPFIPKTISQENIDFIQRMTEGDHLDIRTDCGVSSASKNFFSENQTKEFEYRYQNTGSQIKFGKMPCKAHSMKKVICSKSGYLRPYYDDCLTGVTENSWVIPVDSEEEANAIIAFLNSDDVKKYAALASSDKANAAGLYRSIGINKI